MDSGLVVVVGNVICYVAALVLLVGMGMVLLGGGGEIHGLTLDILLLLRLNMAFSACI